MGVADWVERSLAVHCALLLFTESEQQVNSKRALQSFIIQQNCSLLPWNGLM